MKKIIITLALSSLIFATTAVACKNNDCGNPDINMSNSDAKAKANANSNSESNSESNSNSSASGGKANSNSNLTTGDIGSHNIYNSTTKTTLPTAPLGKAKIGAVSKSTAVFYLQGQYEEDDIMNQSKTIGGGISIPITWGSGVNDAMKTESARLIVKLRRERLLEANDCLELYKEAGMFEEMKKECLELAITPK